jgi:hypothetical protein
VIYEQTFLSLSLGTLRYSEIPGVFIDASLSPYAPQEKPMP